MKTRFIALFVLLILLFSGCQPSAEMNSFRYSSENASNTPLVICVDLENFTIDGGDTSQRDLVMREMLYTLEHTGGLDDVVIQFVPPNGNEREIILDRLRAEIMSGAGPDVFLMTFIGDHDIDAANNLFEYPQKAMENGIFLPLDKYIENQTQFTEWDKQTKSVLCAGQNDEGQQIIPLSYTLPLLVYQKTDADYTPERDIYWQDMLTDKDLAPFALDLANCYDAFRAMGQAEDSGVSCYYMEYILGDLVDFEKEELLFTEDELLQRVYEILSLDLEDAYDDEAQELFLGTQLSNNVYNQPITLIPMYSDDGGVTAQIESYIAVNRNTKRPDEAYRVIDVLMSKYVQQQHKLYSDYIYYTGVPMHEDLFQQSTPIFNGSLYMTDENYQELCEVRSQISGANFSGEYKYILNVMLHHCRHPENYKKTIEEIVHETYEDLQRRVRE